MHPPMHPDSDVDRVRSAVVDASRRLLRDRRPEQPPLTAGDIAADLGLDMPVVVEALQALAGEHLDVRVTEDWYLAEIRGVHGDGGAG